MGVRGFHLRSMMDVFHVPEYIVTLWIVSLLEYIKLRDSSEDDCVV